MSSSSSQLSSEIKKISDKTNCGCDGDYIYSQAPLVSEQSDGGYPYIDQVIYREWNESIIFKSTSTVFHRVNGAIRWYKSKSDGNEGNPIFLDGVLNSTYWEPINDCDDTNVFLEEFVYESGSQEFSLNAVPSDILIVSINGQGPLMRQDYSVNQNVLTILPPTELSEGAEIVVIGMTGGVQSLTNNEKNIYIWEEGDGYEFSTTLNIYEAVNLFVNGIEYDEDTYFNITPESNEFTITNMTLEEGDVIKFVYKSSVE